MKSYTKVLAAVAVAAIMCICPAIVMADGSEAITVTEGEKAYSVEIDSLTEEQLNQLYTSSSQTDWAEEVLSSFMNSIYSFNITELKVTDFSMSKGVGSKVTSDSSKNVVGADMEFTVSFKATAMSDMDYVLDENKALFPIVKAIGTNNTGKTGDVYEVTSKVKISGSETDNTDFTKTDSGIYVNTGGYSNSYTDYEFDTSVTLTKKADSSKVEFDVYVQRENSHVVDADVDTNGKDVAEITSDSVVYVTLTTETKSRVEIKGSADGDSETDVTTSSNKGTSSYLQEDPALITDIAPRTYTLVGNTSCLFSLDDIADSDLKTDAGMKSFLDGIGASPSESYSDAESVADDTYGTIVDDETVAVGLLAIAVGVLVILLIVLVIVIVIILIVKRKKN